jgi:hypothetical protein
MRGGLFTAALIARAGTGMRPVAAAMLPLAACPDDTGPKQDFGDARVIAQPLIEFGEDATRGPGRGVLSVRLGSSSLLTPTRSCSSAKVWRSPAPTGPDSSSGTAKPRIATSARRRTCTPNDTDTDDDGFPDDIEVNLDKDPLNPNDHP